LKKADKTKMVDMKDLLQWMENNMAKKIVCRQ